MLPILGVVIVSFMTPVYEGNVGLRIGVLGDIQSLTSSGNLQYADKNVWILKQVMSGTLIADQHSLAKAVLSSFAKSSEKQKAYVTKVDIVGEEAISIVAVGRSVAEVEKHLSEIAMNILKRHNAKYDSHMRTINSEISRLKQLTEDITNWLNQKDEFQREANGLTYFAAASVVEKIVSLESYIAGLRLLASQTTPTEVLGTISSSSESVSPNYVNTGFALLLIGSALSLTLLVLVLIFTKRD